MKTSLSEHFTSPPKTFTEDSLLSAMETAGNDSFDEDTEKKGLGTPATRAEMIEKLVRNSYVQRKGKQLIPTEDGMIDGILNNGDRRKDEDEKKLSVMDKIQEKKKEVIDAVTNKPVPKQKTKGQDLEVS